MRHIARPSCRRAAEQLINSRRVNSSACIRSLLAWISTERNSPHTMSVESTIFQAFRSEKAVTCYANFRPHRPPLECSARTCNRSARHSGAYREGRNASRRDSEQASNSFRDDECTRLDDIYGVYCLMAATCDRGSHICKILDITRRDSCAGLVQSSAPSKAQASIGPAERPLIEQALTLRAQGTKQGTLAIFFGAPSHQLREKVAIITG